MIDTTELDKALEAALEGYSPNQRKKALALIANGTIRPVAAGNAWLMPSGRYKDVTYLVVIDVTAAGTRTVWCNCPRGATGEKCYQGAAGIMLHVNAAHEAAHEPPVYSDDPPGADARTMGELQLHRPDPFAGIPNADDTANQPF